MQTDLIDFVEAAYCVEASEDTWLTGVLRAAAPIVDSGLGLVSYTYDASNPGSLRLETFVSQGMPPAHSAAIAHGASLLSADYVRASYLSLSCGTSSEVPGWHEQREAAGASDIGIADTLVMNAMTPSGQGCLVMAPLAQELRMGVRRRNVLTKLTCHLAAAHRLRRLLAHSEARPPAPEAILDRDGNIQHAEGEARSKSARSCLKRSVAAITRSRGTLRTSDPERAVDEWKGLIAARWTLLDVCERDGTKYLVARQNPIKTPGPNGLTDREREVVAFAVAGHHNKLIAYNLRISHSTSTRADVSSGRKDGRAFARGVDPLLVHIE